MFSKNNDSRQSIEAGKLKVDKSTLVELAIEEIDGVGGGAGLQQKQWLTSNFPAPPPPKTK